MNSMHRHPLRAVAVATLACLLSACAGKSAGPSDKPGQQACTTEAKMCPDGSGVGRTGPNCEFAPCPGAPAPDAAAAPDATPPDAAPAPTP